MHEIRVDKLKLGKVSETTNGFLKGRAAVTRTGVFEYYNLDGTKRFELRHPNDVLDPASLESLKSLPITHDHPTELVTAENAAFLSVGMTGETIEVNDGHVMVSLNITHKNAIAAIKKGKQELSCGYTVNVIPEVGEYNGQKYTHRQTNIDYNHLAFVSIGRAGADVRLNLDGAYVQCDEITKKEVMKINKDNDAETVIEQLAETVVKETTGIDVPKAAEEIENIGKAAESIVEKVEEVTNTDSLHSTIEQLRAENEKLRSVNVDALVIEKTKERAALLSKASSVINIDMLIDKSEREIMEATILTKLDKPLDLKTKSDDYVNGRFDSVIEDLPSSIFKQQMIKKDAKSIEGKVTTMREALDKQIGKR